MKRKLLPLAVMVSCALLAASCSKDKETAKRDFVRSGDAYVAKKQLPQAIIEYRKAIQLDGQFAEARKKLADAYLQAGDINDGFKEALRAADLLPNDIEMQIKAGNLELGAGKFEDAKARANKILMLQPTSVDAQILRGNSLALVRDFDGAIAQLEAAVKEDPDSAVTYSDLGAFQFVKGDRDKAEQAFKQAVRVAPQSVQARLALSNFYWASGNRPESEKILKEALGLAPRDVAVNRALAFLYVSLGRIAEAEVPLKLIADDAKDPGARIVLADYYRATGRVPLALQTLDALAEDPKTFAVARARKAAVLYSDGKKAEAYAAVDEALAKDAKSGPALFQKAEMLAADQDFTQALKLAQASVAVNPRLLGARMSVGRIQAHLGQWDESIGAYNEALKLSPKLTDALLEVAAVQLAAGRPQDGLRSANEALALQPNSGQALLLKARSLLLQGKATEAEGPMKVLAAKFPTSLAVQVQLGSLYMQKHDPVAARAAYERAWKGDSTDVDALNGLTALDFAEKKGPSAKARVDAALAQHADSTPLMLLAARAYNTLGDSAGAEKLVRRILEREPANLDAYGFLGEMFQTQHRMDEAIAEFEEIARRQPKSVAIQTAIGVLLQMQNKPQEATKRYELVLGLDKQAAVAANNLAMLYVESDGNLDTALQYAQTAKSQLPDRPEINDTLGWVYVRKGLGSLALPSLLQALEKDPNNAGYHYHVGMAYVSTGEKEKARASLQKALTLDPNFDGAAKARQALAGLKG